ncbi:MAG: HD domain-containing protein [Nitrospirae bacterium]|nr:HD domain-containing protein [Nitrospirota bacterium]
MTKKQREIRDPIHGFIQRSAKEEKIIDLPVFQRLRGIKQLAMANLVYPGALHTRFGHSLGVMHIVGKLAERLEVEEDGRIFIRLAALLHDIGHGPFSHVSENILDKYNKSEVNPKSKEKIHELITSEIIQKNSELGSILSEDDRKQIVGYLQGQSGESVVKDIISGPLDGDKQDYLLRDSYYCGVKYGIFDIDRLVGTLEAYQQEHDHILAVSKDGLYVIEQFVLAKYHMTTQVYRHRIRLISDAMITRALELGIDVDKLEFLKKLYFYDGTQEFIDNYIEWDDARLSNEILFHGSEGYAKDIFQMLKQRKLLKVVFSKPIREFTAELEFTAEDRYLLSRLSNMPDLRKKIEKETARCLSDNMNTIDPNYVIMNTVSIKSVREQSRNNEGPILILKSDGQPRIFEDESTLFRSINESESDAFIEIYAPVLPEEEVGKLKRRDKHQNLIHEIIHDIIKTSNDDQLEQKGEQP